MVVAMVVLVVITGSDNGGGEGCAGGAVKWRW